MSHLVCVDAHSLRQLMMAGEIMAVVLDRNSASPVVFEPDDNARLVNAWRNVAMDVRKEIDMGKVPC